MSQTTNPERDDEDGLTLKESWRLIAEKYDGDPAGEIARIQLESMEDTN